jgi:hypothetical protein
VFRKRRASVSSVFAVMLMIMIVFALVDQPFSATFSIHAQKETNQIDESAPVFIGVNVRGLYTSLQHERYPDSVFPKNYYEDSFRLIHDAGMNAVRYVFYWEAYEKNPELFMQELQTVARTADRYGIRVIYDNHQYQTSSWLDPKNGTGFPASLFHDINGPLYEQGSGGKTHHESSKIWWTKWWNRSIKDASGADGWVHMAEFLRKIVNAVDDHTSTLGYEILNEPQIHNDRQWKEVGEFNTYMVKELRKITQKIIVFSQQIPGSKSADTINITPKNIAKMAPDNKTNVIFKFTLYRLPEPNSYHDERFKTYVEAGEISNIPVLIGEWNNVERVKVKETNNEGVKTELYKIDAGASDIDHRRAASFIEKFEESPIWGWAYWGWNYITNPVPPVNLVTVGMDGKVHPTKYLEILKNAISDVYGQ